MGGEKAHRSVPSFRIRGSPPRGRGKALPSNIHSWLSGITPAWAGKSFRVFLCIGFTGDHPRVGGEKRHCGLHFHQWRGSPPRGRGKVDLVVVEHRLSGITPAWAGKRQFRLVGVRCPGDHPRVGGEKSISIRFAQDAAGSPPRGRGKAAMNQSTMNNQGITPAWAGKRLKRSHRSGIFISGPIPFHSVLHRPAGSGGSRAGRDGSPAGQPQNAGPAWAAYSSSPPTPYGGQGAKHRCCGW